MCASLYEDDSYAITIYLEYIIRLIVSMMMRYNDANERERERERENMRIDLL
jgi:hypothetical protein